MARKLLGEILREQGAVAEEDLNTALGRQRDGEKDVLGHILFDLGAASERDLQRAYGLQLGREFVDLRETVLSAELIGRLSGELARRHCAIPIREEDGRVVVALANPLDVRALSEIGKHLGCPVRSAIACASDLEAAIERHYE